MKDKKIHGNIDIIDSSVCYFQIIKSHRNELMTICEMQSFDEGGYDQTRFVTNSDDKVHCFETAEMAKIKLNKWFETEEIDYEYRIDNNLIRE